MKEGVVYAWGTGRTCLGETAGVSEGS
jgi:hypothetical protein